MACARPMVWTFLCAMVWTASACASDDANDGSDATTSSGTSTGGCTPGSDGCACRETTPQCDPLLLCEAGTCVPDTESDSGPSTSNMSGTDTTAGTDDSTDATATGSDGSTGTADTGGSACTDSTDCPRGEVCIAPAAEPGIPSGPFFCSRTCAGLGLDAAVCTDDASCCGAFCDAGSCLAP